MITDLILITLAPALILFSLPLTIFAAITTTLAISTLFLRALIAYVELAAFLARTKVALISSQLISHTRSSSPSAFTTSSSAEDPPIISSNGLDRSDSRKLKLSHRASIASNGPLTPRPFGESNMSGSGGGGIYGRNSAGVFGQRDFEGVGGWGMEDSDDEDRVPWTDSPPLWQQDVIYADPAYELACTDTVIETAYELACQNPVGLYLQYFRRGLFFYQAFESTYKLACQNPIRLYVQ
ncbi:hypothetical protein MMC31_008210 [Peltigera leucophlebia]|nr:hypothetical protein [Peltigera leucophlebia]